MTFIEQKHYIITHLYCSADRLQTETMEEFKLDGFFTESSIEWPGQAFSLKVKKELYHQKSDYQDVKVIERYVYQYFVL